MVVFEKSAYRDNINDNSSHKEGGFFEENSFHVMKHLKYRQSSLGVDVYVPEEVQCILLLESVRNLKLKRRDGDEFVVNCIAGTIFVMPADQAIVITWPQAVYFLDVKLNNSHFGDNLNFFSEKKGEKISIFASKKCLQIGKIISESLENSVDSDNDFIKSLYNVLSNLIVKGYFLSQEVSANSAGLSSYACRQIENHLRA